MRKAACLENDSRMKVSQRQPRVVAGNGRIDVDRLLKLNHEPTADDEQNGGESQPQRSVRDMNCHPAADHNTGDRSWRRVPGKTKTGRLWTHVSDERPFAGARPPAALFCYSPVRKGEHPRVHLNNFCGAQPQQAPSA